MLRNRVSFRDRKRFKIKESQDSEDPLYNEDSSWTLTIPATLMKNRD